MTKILILGATGNLAGLATAALAGAKDVQLRLTSSRDDGVQQLRTTYPDAEVVQADWYDAESLRRAFVGVNRVLVVSNDIFTDETVATPNLIEAAKTAPHLDLLVRVIGTPPGVSAADMTDEWRATGIGTAQRWISMPMLEASGLPVAYVNAVCWIAVNLLWMAEEIKAAHRLPYPRSLDGPKMWIAEQDIADVLVKVLLEGPARHAGKEHVLTGTERLTFSEVAALLSDETGEKITWVDTDEALRAAMGDETDKLITALVYEQRHSGIVPTCAQGTRKVARHFRPHGCNRAQRQCRQRPGAAGQCVDSQAPH